MQQRIAIVGSGISGLLCARLLATEHDVALFEAADTLGGHTHTVDVDAFGRRWTVDTGFMVFNDRTYPNFLRMLGLLGIDTQPSDMSFSVRCDQSGLEYQGSSLGGLFAQRRNLVRPAFYRLLRDIVRFNRVAPRVLDEPELDVSLGEFLAGNQFADQFASHYLLPMTAAIWSAPREAMLQFPMSFLVQFLQNHGLLQIRGRPQWRTIPGGARRYVAALSEPLGTRVRTSSTVTSVAVRNQHVQVTVGGDQAELFDAAVIATHAPQTLRMLSQATPSQREILGAFPYQSNRAVLHTDRSFLPRRRRAWASWNYRVTGDPRRPVSVTYDLSRLQRVASPTPLLLTLNPARAVDPERVLRRIKFEHPLFGAGSLPAQSRRAELHADGKLFFCGAYWGYGFHEDGVNSALAVCRYFDKGLDDLHAPCIAVSTKVESGTSVGNP